VKIGPELRFRSPVGAATTYSGRAESFTQASNSTPSNMALEPARISIFVRDIAMFSGWLGRSGREGQSDIHRSCQVRTAERSALTDKFGYSETDDLLSVGCFS
jgi:hypothetical protein